MILLALFPLLGQTIPPGPFSYPGQSEMREEIIVDPQNCPVLDQAYERLLMQLPHNEQEILETVFTFVREELFDLTHCHKQDVDALIQSQTTQTLPLDLFLSYKTGVCRHIALTTSLLLQRLVNEGYLKGKILFIRENIKNTQRRHAWTIFISDTATWYLDPYWNILDNAQTPKGFERLKTYYGLNASLQDGLLFDEKDPH